MVVCVICKTGQALQPTRYCCSIQLLQNSTHSQAGRCRSHTRVSIEPDLTTVLKLCMLMELSGMSVRKGPGLCCFPLYTNVAGGQQHTSNMQTWNRSSVLWQLKGLLNNTQLLDKLSPSTFGSSDHAQVYAWIGVNSTNFHREPMLSCFSYCRGS